MNNKEPILGGGGGLGPYWDAPGSNYYNLTDKQKKLMDQIKIINRNFWSDLRYQINHNNKNYSEEDLLKYLD